MYTRGIITDEVSQDLEVVMRLMRRFQVTGAEIRTIWNTPVDRLAASQVQQLNQRLADEGLMVPAVATPFLKCDLGDAAQYQEHLEILRRSIDVAQALGTPLLRVFTFWRKTPLKNWDPILEAYRQPIEIARQNGVVLCIENEPSCYVGTGAELGGFLRLLNVPEVRGIWDPGNTVAEPAFPDGYAHVRGLCPHIHIKDLKVQPDGHATSVLLGDGDLDIAGQLQALLADGYSGCISLETHWRPQQLAEALLRLPGGEQFSAFGEEASTLCFQRWDALETELRQKQ
ncbi:MAG TPA: sugar phosphate isomerase/epimerase family protein [Chloroflexota bacterium]|jgi:sugar phosphate isomerase/epimerase